MIGLSKTMVRIMNHQDQEAASGVKMLYVFSGVAPTKAEIESIKAMDATGNNELYTGNILSFAQGRGDNLLTANFYDKAMLPNFPSDTLIQWPLSERTEEFRHIMDGTIGWFFFATSNSGLAEASIDKNDAEVLNVKLLVAAFGNAGDEESEADFAILSGEVDGNKEYSTTDLEIAYI